MINVFFALVFYLVLFDQTECSEFERGYLNLILGGLSIVFPMIYCTLVARREEGGCDFRSIEDDGISIRQEKLRSFLLASVLLSLPLFTVSLLVLNLYSVSTGCR